MQGTEPNTGTRARAGGAQYEFQQLHMPRGTSRSDARRILTEQAEYGLWELERLTIRRDGSRRVLLRRRIIRQLRLT